MIIISCNRLYYAMPPTGNAYYLFGVSHKAQKNIWVKGVFIIDRMRSL